MPSPGAPPYGLKKKGLLVVLGIVFELLVAILTLSLRAIPLRDLLVVMGVTLYVSVVNSCLDRTKHSPRPFKPLAPIRRFIRPVLAISFFVSIVIPSVWIAITSSRKVVDLLAPHLFLIACQALFEVWSYRPEIAVVIRLFIPLAFNAYRLGALLEWCVRAWQESMISMKILAATNAAFWAFGFFYILLKRVLPQYL